MKCELYAIQYKTFPLFDNYFATHTNKLGTPGMTAVTKLFGEKMRYQLANVWVPHNRLSIYRPLAQVRVQLQTKCYP